MTSENDICLFTLAKKEKNPSSKENECSTVARLGCEDYRPIHLTAKCDLQIIRQPT